MKSKSVSIAAACVVIALAASEFVRAQPAGVDRNLFMRLYLELECKPGQKCDTDAGESLSRSIGRQGRTRPVKPNLDNTAGREALEAEVGQKAYPSSDVEITFEYNSAELQDKSRATLDTIAALMMDRKYANAKFAIVGHTDGKGGDEFNMDLSQRRATAAREYLEKVRQIGPERLAAWGKGKRALKFPKEPLAPANRRVQLVNLGDMSTADASGGTSRANGSGEPAASSAKAGSSPMAGPAPQSPSTALKNAPSASGTKGECRYVPQLNITLGC